MKRDTERERALGKARMRAAMVDLLGRLERLSAQYEELEDSDVAEAMTMAIHGCFLRTIPARPVPDQLGMASAQGNRQVCTALERYIKTVRPIADRLRLNFHERLAVFQDPKVTRGNRRIDYNDFFRYTPPDAYDATGEPIR